MQTVERHRFVDTALQGQAYEDTSLPIGLSQTISKPGVVARTPDFCQRAHREPGARFGHSGTGCGYQAAVLSLLAREVYSMERLRGLHDKARDNLRFLRLATFNCLFGDGMAGFAQGCTVCRHHCSGRRSDSAACTDQLAVGGRLVAPVAAALGVG